MIKIKKYHNMNAAELFDTVFDLFKESFWMQMLMSLVTSVISGVAMLVFTLIGVVGLFVTRFSQNTVMGILIVSLVLMIILPLILAFTSSGKMHLARQAFYGSRINLGLAISETFKTLLFSTTAIIAITLISIPFIAAEVMALYLYLNYIGILNGFMLNSLGLYRIMSISFVMGFFAIMLAAAVIFSFLYVITSVTLPVAIFEKRYFFGALIRAFELIKNDFWKIYGIQMVWIGVSYSISYSMILVFSISLAVVNLLNNSFVNIDIMNSIILFAQYAFSIILGIAIAPLPHILSSVIYFNQCVKKEGLDIKIGFENLSVQMQYKAFKTYGNR